MAGRFCGVLLFLLIAAPVLLGAALVSPRPGVGERPAAGAADAQAARALARRFRAATEPGGTGEMRIALAEIEAAMAFGARVLPGLRGEAAIEGERLVLRLAAPVPRLGWVTAEAAVPEFDGGLRLGAVRVGALDLPPGLALAAAEWIGDLAMGGSAGARMRAALSRLEVEADGVQLGLALDAAGRRALLARASALLSGEEMPTGAEIGAELRALRAALERGALPETGSVLPYLRLLVERARAVPGAERRALTAGLFALTKLCGRREFRILVGRLAAGPVPETGRAWTKSCDAATLGGRVDLKRHFVTAAALEAASTMSVSFALGEFKELLDAAEAGGFDFTDIAANAAGIRFAARFLGAEPADWPGLLARIRREGDVMPALDGIPGRMDAARFAARFGDVESPAYAAMLAEIAGRIDRLALHRAP